MSKSLQNVVEPNMLIDTYGVDVVRYFLMREVPFGLDGDFSHASLISRINSDLANDLGNLLSRSTAMLVKYFNGELQAPGPLSEQDQTLKEKAVSMVATVDNCMDELAFSKALQAIWDVVSAANKYIDETAPWAMAKDPAQQQQLGTVMYCLLEAQRLIHSLIAPFMPDTSRTALHCLGWHQEVTQADLVWSGLQSGTVIAKASALFPRIETK